MHVYFRQMSRFWGGVELLIIHNTEYWYILWAHETVDLHAVYFVLRMYNI